MIHPFYIPRASKHQANYGLVESFCDATFWQHSFPTHRFVMGKYNRVPRRWVMLLPSMECGDHMHAWVSNHGAYQSKQRVGLTHIVFLLVWKCRPARVQQCLTKEFEQQLSSELAWPITRQNFQCMQSGYL